MVYLGDIYVLAPIDSSVRLIKIVIGSKKIDSLSFFCTAYCFPLDVRWLSFRWKLGAHSAYTHGFDGLFNIAPIYSLIHFEKAITCFEIKSYARIG